MVSLGPHTRLLSLLVVCLFALGLETGVAFAQGVSPRVAIWSPEHITRGGAFGVNPAVCAAAEDALHKAGITVTQVTAADFSDPTKFSGSLFDVLMMDGNVIPADAKSALERFADAGGVIVGLNAQTPFFLGIAQNDQGDWQLSPPKPDYAWERRDFMSYLGLKADYPPGENDLGVQHEPTNLLLKYIPGCATVHGTLASRWIRPDAQAEFYPLLRSHRPDYQDALPSLYIVKNGKRFSIISTTDILTAGTDPSLWPNSAATVVALARLALDLRQGSVVLTPDMKMDIQSDGVQLPLRSRFVRGSVEPENATPIIRWGKFDGASYEFGPMLDAGKKKSIPLGASSKDFPSALAPGASIECSLPSGFEEKDHPLFLRIRGAYAATGAGLKATWGTTVLLNEEFSYLVSPDFVAGRYTNLPTEFTRIIFLPPDSSAHTLTLENTGQQPVYFDAVQVERRTQPSPDMVIALNSGNNPASLPKDLAKDWGPLRHSVRTNLVGDSSDPDRWKVVYGMIDEISALNPRLHLIAEGTPSWAAISPKRYAEGVNAHRPQTVPPDTVKYADLIAEIAQHYKGQVAYWEVWNEADIQQFWRGTADEYVAFFKAIAPVLKQADPSARVLCDVSGYNEQFISKLVDADAPKDADLIAFHPYCKKSPAWDVPLGEFEGYLFSRGVNKEIFSDESGFTFRNAEWFTPPPTCTPLTQRDDLDIALARAFSNGLAKMSVFNAGGDDSPYSIFDQKGHPRPAYDVFADYVPLGLNGARRLDVSMTAADGSPLYGVYLAASSSDNGTTTLVVNPAENPDLRPAPNPSSDCANTAGWTVFFGSAHAKDHKTTVTSDPGKTAGYYMGGALDVASTPNMEVSVPEATGTWSLYLKLPDNKSITLAENQGAGTFKTDLRKVQDQITSRDVQISFRITGTVVFDGVRFSPDAGDPPKKKTVPVLLRIPLSNSTPVKATIRAGGAEQPAEVTMHTSAGISWAELKVDLGGRSVITLK